MCQCRINAIFVFILIIVNNEVWAHQSNHAHSNWTFIYFPYIALIGSMNTKQDIICCAGTIISPSWVLTSNNCKLKNDKNQLSTSFATSSISNLKDIPKAPLKFVKQWIEHPQFIVDNYSVTHDVALLYLTSSFFINNDIKIMPLASERVTNRIDFFIEGCQFYFWTVAKLTRITNLRSKEYLYNVQNTTELTYMEIKVLSREACLVELNNSAVLTYGQVCGIEYGNNDLNQEHTGGPLICRGIQFGFYTWRKKIPGKGFIIIFTKVGSFSSYITRIVPEVQFAKKVKTKSHVNKKGYLFPIDKKASGGRKSFEFNIFILIMSTIKFFLVLIINTL